MLAFCEPVATLGDVVGKRHPEVGEESQHRILELFQPFQQVPDLSLARSAAFFLFRFLERTLLVALPYYLVVLFAVSPDHLIGSLRLALRDQPLFRLVDFSQQSLHPLRPALVLVVLDHSLQLPVDVGAAQGLGHVVEALVEIGRPAIVDGDPLVAGKDADILDCLQSPLGVRLDQGYVCGGRGVGPMVLCLDLYPCFVTVDDVPSEYLLPEAVSI